MAYITTSNAKSILFNVKLENNAFNGPVFNRSIHSLNRLEVTDLLGFKEFISNPHQFVEKYYRQISKVHDNSMIFNHKTPAYHDHSDCELLNSDYLNYQIPQEILDSKNEALIEKYRAWFLKNYYLIESGEATKLEAMKERCRLKFGLSTLPEIVQVKNSGVSLFHEKSLLDIEREINQIISESDVFVHASAKNRRILNRFQKLAYLGEKYGAIKDNNTGFSDDEVREVLREFQQDFKKPVIDLLKEWYRIQYNPKLSIDKILLEALGFKKCSKCAAAQATIIGEACYASHGKIAA